MTDKKPTGRPADLEEQAPAPFPSLGRADGPWEYADAPSDAAFIAFGPLRVPAVATLQVRVEIDPKVQKAGAVSVRVDGCMLQLQLFAAPRGKGAWEDLRRQIARKAQALGGRTTAAEGSFGPELIVSLPARRADGLAADVSSRYVGVEGDRWTIRAVVQGGTALDKDVVAKVDDFLSRCAVDRGPINYGPGTVIPLELPDGEVATVPAGGDL